jgi:hypothetical protein
MTSGIATSIASTPMMIAANRKGATSLSPQGGSHKYHSRVLPATWRSAAVPIRDYRRSAERRGPPRGPALALGPRGARAESGSSPGGDVLNLFRRGDRPVRAAEAVFESCLKAEDIWKDVCRLEPYAVSPTLACCEVAFARIAILKYIFLRSAPDAAQGEEMCALADRLTREGFAHGDEETDDFYGLPLAEAAAGLVAAYLDEAGHPAPLTALLVRRIGAGPDLVLQHSELFRAFANRAAAALPRLRA